mmetsp:Transcript_85686/g.171133  ORF Transcript_85686/g.171133 Transcript_85686/m.171133 type:complete len:106 (-) Transcript_85686:2835-3152(-)
MMEGAIAWLFASISASAMVPSRPSPSYRDGAERGLLLDTFVGDICGVHDGLEMRATTPSLKRVMADLLVDLLGTTTLGVTALKWALFGALASNHTGKLSRRSHGG